MKIKNKVLMVLLIFTLTLAAGMVSYAADGTWCLDANGWWYGYDENSYAANEWVEYNGNWYHFNAEGYMQTGWIYDGSWYYLHPDGSMATGWIQDGTNRYYLYPNGTLAYGWVWYDDNWYCMSASGSMLTGWIEYDGNWYYLNTDGTMAVGWVLDSGCWFYLYPDGIMAVGWVEDDGIWYYMNAYGVMETGWLSYGGSSYYLDASGAMVTGIQTIDGETYTFDSDGRCQDDDKRAYAEVRTAARNVLDQTGWDLYAAYKWSVGLSYNINLYTGSTTSESALYSFKTHTADCVGMASTFCWMARELGYEARVIDGTVPYRSGGYGEHAWVEIEINGSTYVCDPDFEMQMGSNGYMIYYGQSATWKYAYDYSTDIMAD